MAERWDVFISYASDDEAAAYAIWRDLRRTQIPYLSVEESGRGLSTPARVLTRALDECDRLLVVWSSSAANAPWVHYEWFAFTSMKSASVVEVVALDDTPFPADAVGVARRAEPSWLGAPRESSRPAQVSEVPVVPPPRATPRLYVTASRSGEAQAERIAFTAAELGYEVIRIWQLASKEERMTKTRPAGDWIVLAHDADGEPFEWELAFGDNPDRYPRRLVVRTEGAIVPTLLRLSPSVPDRDESAIRDWLCSAGHGVGAASLARSWGWEHLAKRLHDRLPPDFSALDLRLEFVDPRLKSALVRIRNGALVFVVAVHALAGILSTMVPLNHAPTTRRHLVLSLTMVVLSSLAIHVQSFAAGLAILVHAGALSAFAVLVSGHFNRHGIPGGALAAGAVLAAMAGTQALLAPRVQRLTNRPVAAALRGGGALAAAGVVLLGGLLLLVRAGDLRELAAWQRLLWGLVFGWFGGSAVGGALTWMAWYFHRRRDRARTLRRLLVGGFLGAPIGAVATVLSASSANDLRNGLGVGAFAAAVLVVLWLAPSANMRHLTDPRLLPYICAVLAIAAGSAVALLFPNVHDRQLLSLYATAGLVLGTLTVVGPSLVLRR